MTAQRRRRVQPIKKTTQTARKKRSIGRPPGDIPWGSLLLKSITTVVFVVNLVLIAYVFKQCTKSPVPAVQSVARPVSDEPIVMRIEVLNGCGVPQLAARFTDFLRAEGYDVVKTDNYESHNVEHSVVIDRRGNQAASNRLARVLGVGTAQVLQEVNSGYLIDATVILGKDFRSLTIWEKTEQNRGQL